MEFPPGQGQGACIGQYAFISMQWYREDVYLCPRDERPIRTGLVGAVLAPACALWHGAFAVETALPMLSVRLDTTYTVPRLR